MSANHRFAAGECGQAVARQKGALVPLLLICLISLASVSSVRAAVEQWGVFELALAGPTNGNPYVDVDFSARFTQGTNAVTVPGFYDEGGVYRVRFMPASQGEWRYETRSNRRALHHQRGRFTVVVPAMDNHGPVRVTNTFHFAYADGTPYRQLGTTCYHWLDQEASVQGQTLQTLAASPFNKIRFCLFPKRYVGVTNEPLFPFMSKGTNFDTGRFNPTFFRHFEQGILDLQKLGIEADIILFHPYDKGGTGFDRMTAVEDDRYLRYVVARLAAYRNVWWSLANEYDFMKYKTEADWERIGRLVASADPYHRLLSIHNGTMIFDHSRSWITHASIQNGSAVTDPNSAGIYRDVWRKPVVYDEVKYEGDYPRRWGRLTAEELVFRFWNGMVAGTYVGHGETFETSPKIYWWYKGGTLAGQSLPRLKFLKQVLDDAPAAGLEPIDKWQNPEYGGRPFEYYLVYLGRQTPTNWMFRLPKSPWNKTPGQVPVEGMKFTAEVLDTWNMTVTPVPGVFVLNKPTERPTEEPTGKVPGKMPDYFISDQAGRSIELPGLPYQAIRIKRVKD